MDTTPISYATPAASRAKPQLTPEQRRRLHQVSVIVGICLFGIFVVVYTLFLGDNRWRVELHHGIVLPDSARDFDCSGFTYFDVPGGHSIATFTIDPADLISFLAQFPAFEAYSPINRPGAATQPLSGPPPASSAGTAAGRSTTGRDWAWMYWETKGDGVVIEFHTEWN